MPKPELNIIYAETAERGIGYNNDLPWKGDFPEDLQRFKDLTKGHVIIMGYNTFASLGFKPLPSRANVVITKNHLYDLGDKNVVVFPSLDEAVTELSGYELYDKLFIIGGEQIYNEAVKMIDKVDNIYTTTITSPPYKCDRYVPDFHTLVDGKWTMYKSIHEDHKNKTGTWMYRTYKNKQLKD